MVTESAAAKRRVLYGQINAVVLLLFGGLSIYSLYLIYSNWGASSTPTEYRLDELVRGETPSNRHVVLNSYQTLDGYQLEGRVYYPIAPWYEEGEPLPAGVNGRAVLIAVFSGHPTDYEIDLAIQEGRGMISGVAGSFPPEVRTALKKSMGESSINDMKVIYMGRRPSWSFAIVMVLVNFTIFVGAGVYAFKNMDND